MVLEDTLYVERSLTGRVNKKTKASVHHWLRKEMQKDYCSVYISAFQDTDEEQYDYLEENVKKSVNLILADPLYTTRGDFV